MFYTTPTSKLKQNWHESSSFLAFSWKRKRETKKRQGHVQQSWPDKDTLSHLRCVTFLIFFFVSLYFSFRKVWQKRYCIAKEGMFTLAHSPVRIFSINSNILQVSLISLLVWLTQKRLLCKSQLIFIMVMTDQKVVFETQVHLCRGIIQQ